MPVPAMPEALSKGVIDGTVIPWEVTTPLKVAELVDSHTDFAGPRGLYTSFFVFAMNKARYEALPDDLKAVLDANSGLAASKWVGVVMDKGDLPGIEAAKKAGKDRKSVGEGKRGSVRVDPGGRGDLKKKKHTTQK